MEVEGEESKRTTRAGSEGGTVEGGEGGEEGVEGGTAGDEVVMSVSGGAAGEGGSESGGGGDGVSIGLGSDSPLRESASPTRPTTAVLGRYVLRVDL